MTRAEGSTPPRVRQPGKGFCACLRVRSIMEATPICSELAYALRMHVTSVHRAVVDMSSDDDAALSSDSNNDFAPVLLPRRHPQMAPRLYVPLDPAGQQMIGQHILFKWLTYRWCLGKMSACNTDPKRKVSKQIVNFTVFYPADGSSGPHCLSLDNYNVDIDNDSPNRTWLLLEPSTP